VTQPLVADTAPGPWRLDDSFSEIEWFAVHGHQRSRYEALNGQFRAGRNEDVSILAFRTAVQADVELNHVSFSAELMDSRQSGADEDTPFGTSTINAFEMIQAHVIFDIGSQLIPMLIRMLCLHIDFIGWLPIPIHGRLADFAM